jgi:FkbM family methyltransferase
MLKRFVPSIRKRLAHLTWPNGRGVICRDGVLYLINMKSGNWVDKEILVNGGLEPDQRAYLLAHIRQRQCGIFLDIGANFGTYAACVALQTDCRTIIAYEPDRRGYDQLRAHLLINGLGDLVQTRLVAVSDHNGTVPFMHGAGSNYGDGGDTVPAVRLDDELPLSGQRIALKIDVEGHELAALQGMKSLLRNNDCFLQVECWKENAATFVGAVAAEGYRFLHQIGDDHYFGREA